MTRRRKLPENQMCPDCGTDKPIEEFIVLRKTGEIRRVRDACSACEARRRKAHNSTVRNGVSDYASTPSCYKRTNLCKTPFWKDPKWAKYRERGQQTGES